MTLVYPGSMEEATTMCSFVGENLDVIGLCLVAKGLEGSALPERLLAKLFLICYLNPLISQAICLRGITFSTRSGFVILMFAHSGQGKHFLFLCRHF